MPGGRRRNEGNGDALDFLEHQDNALLGLFTQLDESTGPAVKARYDHGNQAKRLIRRLALREAAKADVVRVLADVGAFDPLRKHLTGAVEERRNAINALARMGRGVRPLDLNKTQDLDGGIDDVRGVIGPEIAWELAEGITALGRSLSEEQRASLHDARYLRRHAPTSLDPSGFRPHERIRVIGWALTAWDHLRDRPRPVKGARVE